MDQWDCRGEALIHWNEGDQPETAVAHFWLGGRVESGVGESLEEAQASALRRMADRLEYEKANPS